MLTHSTLLKLKFPNSLTSREDSHSCAQGYISHHVGKDHLICHIEEHTTTAHEVCALPV